jgi:hypothetical protein
MDRSAAALEAAGAEILLIDGAVGAAAFAGARVADAVVLSVGMAVAATLEACAPPRAPPPSSCDCGTGEDARARDGRRRDRRLAPRTSRRCPERRSSSRTSRASS